jgi:hypothetical protein
VIGARRPDDVCEGGMRKELKRHLDHTSKTSVLPNLFHGGHDSMVAINFVCLTLFESTANERSFPCYVFFDGIHYL